MDPAVLPVEKDAGPVGLIDQGQTASVGAEAGVALDKVIFPESKMTGDGRDLGLGDFHIARPAAAVGAALAQVFRWVLQNPILG